MLQLREGRKADPTPGIPDMGDHTGKTNQITFGFENKRGLNPQVLTINGP